MNAPQCPLKWRGPPKLCLCKQTHTLVEQVIQVWSHTHTHTQCDDAGRADGSVKQVGELWLCCIIDERKTGGDNRGASPWNWRRWGCRASSSPQSDILHENTSQTVNFIFHLVLHVFLKRVSLLLFFLEAGCWKRQNYTYSRMKLFNNQGSSLCFFFRYRT